MKSLNTPHRIFLKMIKFKTKILTIIFDALFQKLIVVRRCYPVQIISLSYSFFLIYLWSY